MLKYHDKTAQKQNKKMYQKYIQLANTLAHIYVHKLCQ